MARQRAILSAARNSNTRNSTGLMEECTQGLATGLEGFFGDARHAASAMANMHRRTMLAWADGAGDYFSGMVELYPALS